MASNRETGDAFQRLARTELQEQTGLAFDLDVPIAIGTPAQKHKFDLATPDRRVIGECKCLTWTESDRIPSAKIGHLREALQYLHKLPAGTETFVIMSRHCRRATGEPLADFFVRRNRHLLGETSIVELCAETRRIRAVRGTVARPS